MYLGLPYSQQTVAREAYVTFLFKENLFGVFVLGQSLREVDTIKDYVVVYTEDISNSTITNLEKDGWVVKALKDIHSPDKNFSMYLKKSRSFTKLIAWNMTEYRRIALLDSEYIVTKNVDNIFNCGKFCAAFKTSDALFDTGVLVVEPSKQVYKDMIKKLTLLQKPPKEPYDNDQEFLNSFYDTLIFAPMFNWSDNTPQERVMRLPASLNADVGTYYLNSKWVIPKDKLMIIHFHFGPVRPWKWWYNFLFDLNSEWNAIRHRLPHVDRYNYKFYHPIFWAPYLILAIVFSVTYMYSQRIINSWFNLGLVVRIFQQAETLNGKVLWFFPLVFQLISYYFAFLTVPTAMVPSKAEYVFWLWSNFFLCLCFSCYCYCGHALRKPRRKHGHHGRVLASCFLYAVYILTYVLLKIVPQYMHPFKTRLIGFAVLLVIHIFVSNRVGRHIIWIWSRK